MLVGTILLIDYLQDFIAHGEQFVRHAGSETEFNVFGEFLGETTFQFDVIGNAAPSERYCIVIAQDSSLIYGDRSYAGTHFHKRNSVLFLFVRKNCFGRERGKEILPCWCDICLVQHDVDIPGGFLNAYEDLEIALKHSAGHSHHVCFCASYRVVRAERLSRRSVYFLLFWIVQGIGVECHVLDAVYFFLCNAGFCIAAIQAGAGYFLRDTIAGHAYHQLSDFDTKFFFGLMDGFFQRDRSPGRVVDASVAHTV